MKKQVFSYIQAIAALSLVLASCSPESSETKGSSTRRSPEGGEKQTASKLKQVGEVNPQLVAANTRFGFKLFEEIRKRSPDKNIFISPASVAIALGMTYSGAGGETRQAMGKTLELPQLGWQEVNTANAALLASLSDADPKVKFAIANSLWANRDISFQPGFIDKIEDFYAAQISKLNFKDPAAAEQINNWVKQRTNSKIDKIVDRIDPDAILFLVNAIYFKGTWTSPFSKASTRERPFTLLDGSQKQHPLMSRSGEYRYFENELFQAVSLPYGAGRLSLYVFLPKPGSALQTFYNRLNGQTWEQWMQQFKSRPGAVELPRFKLEYESRLDGALKALGMQVAFDRRRADFSGMTPARASIDRVAHKTFVEVNEEGTEAAAATGAGITATSVPTQPPFKMTVDRPFFCVIRDNKTGTLLFMGAIVNPD